MTPQPLDRKGLAITVGTFLIWGVVPLYWHLLKAVPSFQIIAHRIVWSAVLVLGWLLLKNGLGWWRQIRAQPRAVPLLGVSSLLIAFNWGLYIWAINAGHVIETSLGYFINPLVSVVLGVVVLKVEFDALEAQWRSSGEPAWVADPGGVVLVASVPEWRFRATGPMDEARRRLSLTDLTLRPGALAPLPFQTPPGDRPRLVRAAVGEARPQTWMHAQTDTATPGWTPTCAAPAARGRRALVVLPRPLATSSATCLASRAGVGAVPVQFIMQAFARP